jgi:hypothetical protein
LEEKDQTLLDKYQKNRNDSQMLKARGTDKIREIKNELNILIELVNKYLNYRKKQSEDVEDYTFGLLDDESE